MGCEMESMWPIFKTKMSDCQSKAKLDVRSWFGEITHLKYQKIRKISAEGGHVW